MPSAPGPRSIAVTEGRIYAFNAKTSGRKWVIVDAVGDWDRSDLTIVTTPGKLSTKVVVDVKSTGDHYELEATTICRPVTSPNRSSTRSPAPDPSGSVETPGAAVAVVAGELAR